MSDDSEWSFEDEDARPRALWRERLPALFLTLLALGWMGGIGWYLYVPGRLDLITSIALASGPVALLCIAMLLLGMTSNATLRRFNAAAAGLRTEMSRLESCASAMADHMRDLEARGIETSRTISEVNDSMRLNTDTLGRQSLLLGAAATSAREEMKTLMIDLPDVEARMNGLTSLIDKGGEIVASQIVGLQEGLHEVALRGRDAEQTVGQALARLATELERIEGVGARIDPARLAEETERAARATQQAGQKLAQQMGALSATIDQLEARSHEVRDRLEQSTREHFTRQSRALIEALNATSVNIARILTCRISEAQWAAYMHGERGIFTSAALRLLSRREAYEIVQLFEADPDFATQVRRFIHDFEAMMRPILAAQEGDTLGITLLSSDMGRLYVALAQAVDRLRR